MPIHDPDCKHKKKMAESFNHKFVYKQKQTNKDSYMLTKENVKL